jgi:hypothetical protein
MDTRRYRRVTVLLVLLSFLSRGQAESLPAGRPVPVAVRDGRCECVLPTERADSKVYLVLGSLARDPGPYVVRVHAEPTSEPVTLPADTPAVDEAWQRRTRELAVRLELAQRHRPAPHSYPPAEPPCRRTYYLFTGDTNFQDAAGYTAVQGDLRAVGRHCQVYLDHDESDPAALQPTVADVINTFDDEVYPQSLRSRGQALDVDRDGRFTILLTGRLGKLQNGKVALGGFVRGSDFYADLPAPYGNRCDMMYLNTNLRPGPHLRTLLAHEYTHAVVFSEHVFGNYLPGRPRQDEESWLNEGLAHVVEEQHGYGWSNLDYRISAFLNAPEQYPLVVPDAYGAGLWRNAGHRGATYLFVRWCVQQYGTDLPARLIQTNLHGVENLEVATGERFEDLFRHWSTALLQAGANLPPVPGRHPARPHFTKLTLAGGRSEVTLAGTSVAYLLLHSPGGKRTRLTVTAGMDARLQVSLVRLLEDANPVDAPGAVGVP